MLEIKALEAIFSPENQVVKHLSQGQKGFWHCGQYLFLYYWMMIKYVFTLSWTLNSHTFYVLLYMYDISYIAKTIKAKYISQ